MLTSAGLQAIYQDACYLPNTFLFSATCHMTYGPFWGLNLGPFNHHLCFTQGPFSCSFCHLVQHTHTNNSPKHLTFSYSFSSSSSLISSCQPNNTDVSIALLFLRHVQLIWYTLVSHYITHNETCTNFLANLIYNRHFFLGPNLYSIHSVVM